MQKRLVFVPSKQKSHVFLHFSVCLSFNSRGTHLVFWIFPISRSQLETVCWLTPNCSASYFSVCESFRPTVLVITQLRIFCRFSVFLVFLLVLCRNRHFWNVETIAHTYLAMEQVHRKLLEEKSWFGSSFLQMKTKISVVRDWSTQISTH